MSPVNGQKYNVHLFANAPYVETGNGQMRFLQTSVSNTPDLQAAEDICNIQPPRFVCEDTVRLEADDLSFADITISFSCLLDSFSAFDYRRSQGCGCVADIVSSDPNKPIKTCPCSICPAGFGDSPIAIDCTKYEDNEDGIDPFLINTCSSLDCGFNCNGTCAFDCVNSGPECEFCGNANQPTSAPTGQALNGQFGGNGNGNGSGGSGGGGTSSGMLHSYGPATAAMVLLGASWTAL